MKEMRWDHLLNFFGGAVLILCLAGCDMAPLQPVFGAYFPSWMLCVIAGIGATLVMRLIFIGMTIEAALPAPFLVYGALLVAFSCLAGLLWLPA